MRYYPLFMDLQDRECLLVGAGTVAERKLKVLLRCGAHVTVIGERAKKGVKTLASESTRVVLFERPFKESDVKDSYSLIIGATSNENVNRLISRSSQEKGIPVNIVDKPHYSSFIVPSVYQDRDLIIAVSTSGKSPTIAKKIREKIEREFGAEYGDLIEMVHEYRRDVIENVFDYEERLKLWNGILSSNILERLRVKDYGGAREIIKRCIREIHSV